MAKIFRWHRAVPNVTKTSANTAIQNAAFPKVEPFLTANGCGWGLRVCEDVAADTMLCEYTGEVITVNECKKRLQDKSERNEFDVYFAALGGENVWPGCFCCF